MRHRRAKVETTEVDLTPMLDVVFILLIFFIVTAVFLQEDALDVEPPVPGQGQALPTIVVAVDADGFVRVNGRASLVEAVRANIERIRAETPDSAVIIQAHPDTTNKVVLRIRDQLASARVERVNLVLSDV